MLKRIRKILKGLRDPATKREMRFAMLWRLGKRIMPEYRFEWPQLAWWHDEAFNRYLKQFRELDGLNTPRRWMLYQLTRLAGAVHGDTAECGVFEGAGSYLICRSLGEHPGISRTHFIFDSFEGLSAPTMAEGSYWTAGNLTCDLDAVKLNLASVKNISWHKGWIPGRFSDAADRKFCFVHIDVDLYEPTRDSIQFFYPRMNEGGIILCDDYGFTSCPGATRAIEEFLKDKPEKMLALASGGGFLIKGRKTADLAELSQGGGPAKANGQPL